MLAATLRRLRLNALRPLPRVEDPDNEQRRELAIEQMRAFDRFGPEARSAIRNSRFDAHAAAVWRNYGGPYAEDERVATRIRKDDDSYSGQFGPAASRGI